MQMSNVSSGARGLQLTAAELAERVDRLPLNAYE